MQISENVRSHHRALHLWLTYGDVRYISFPLVFSSILISSLHISFILLPLNIISNTISSNGLFGLDFVKSRVVFSNVIYLFNISNLINLSHSKILLLILQNLVQITHYWKWYLI